MGLGHWNRARLFGESSSSSHPEFTFLAVTIGLVIGCLLCFTNLYFGLQTGWISMMSLQSALIGFLISKMLPIPLSPQEIVVVQTTAVATGTMPLAAGFVGIIPALGLLNEEQDGSPPIHLSWIAAVGWSCSIAFFGVFLSPPLRKQVIIEEQLAFPSGTATAQLISVLHKLPPPETSLRRRSGYRALDSEEIPSHTAVDDDVRDVVDDTESICERELVQQEGWMDLTYSFLASATMTLSAYFFPIVFSIPLFGNYLAREWLWSFTPSLSYVGQGIIMGFPTTLSMNLGMIVGWAILSPLSKHAGWAPGPVGDMSTGARGWILWVSLATMCADSFVSLLPIVQSSITKMLFSASKDENAPPEEDHDVETPDRLVPIRWVLSGLVSSVIVGTLLVWVVFGDEGIKPWATLIGFAVGGLLSVLGVRALGETDLNPVSGLGKISQLLFAWLQPGNVVANIIAGGVAEAGATEAADLMQDLKTGHLLHASPRAQFYGQLIGSSLSIIVSASAYVLYQRAYSIPGPSFPAPSAYVWLSLARLLRNGQLPEQTSSFMLLFAILFSVVAGAKLVAVQRGLPYARWIPSGIAFAIGFLNTPSFSLARLVGGLIEYWYHRRVAKTGGTDIRLIIVASGFVLGEGVVSIISLILRTWGIGVASCWGCGGGICPGCPAVNVSVGPLDFPQNMSRIALESIPAITFYKDSLTTARRTAPITQLVCLGKPCASYQPEVVRCRNIGGSGINVDWKCEADLPSSLRFGKVEVSCEGWNGPGDPYVMKGSCSLEYHLVQLPHSLRDDSFHWPSLGVSNFFSKLDMSGILFMLVWFAVLAIISYNLVHSCLRRNYPPTGNTQRVPPPTYPGPGDDGRPRYRYLPGDFQGPPPPYTKDPSSTEGWRPGFWTGTALGALGGSLLNRSQSVPRAYDWERSESRFRTAPRRASFYGDSDRREGPSNLGPLRTSTGYGGSSSR